MWAVDLDAAASCEAEIAAMIDEDCEAGNHRPLVNGRCPWCGKG